MQNNDLYDVVIIGGGPGGMAAAQYAARAKLKTLVIDKNPMAGALGKASRIENYPGIQEPIPGPELLGIMRKQAEDFGAQVEIAQVQGVKFNAEPYEVFTNEAAYNTKCVIIATGSMGRKPSIPGEADFLGRGVSYCATCDAPFFKGKDVAAVGELAVMMDELESISKFVNKIYIVTPTKELSVEYKGIIEANSKLELLQGSRIKDIKGDMTVESIIIKDSEGSKKEIPVAGAFIYLTGAKPIVEFLLGAVELNSDGCIKVDENKATSLPGVYAIGDVTCDHVRQVVVATAEGCIAALSAEKFINDRKRIKPQWG
jgi:thioredoxin reductase (NADPH)